MSVYKDMQIYGLLNLTLNCRAFSELLATFLYTVGLVRNGKNDRAKDRKKKNEKKGQQTTKKAKVEI